MLDPSRTAEFIALLYRSHSVRVHRHSENASVYFVLTDVCKVLNLSNPSYIAKKIDKAFKHKHVLLNKNIKNVVVWVNYDGLVQLFDTLPVSATLAEFWLWCRHVSRNKNV